MKTPKLSSQDNLSIRLALSYLGHALNGNSRYEGGAITWIVWSSQEIEGCWDNRHWDDEFTWNGETTLKPYHEI